MSQQCNNNTASLPIIYRHFESTAGSHIDSIVKEILICDIIKRKGLH